jgi:hypothetical protein
MSSTSQSKNCQSVNKAPAKEQSIVDKPTERKSLTSEQKNIMNDMMKISNDYAGYMTKSQGDDFKPDPGSFMLLNE